MPRQRKRQAQERITPADAQFEAGCSLFRQHPLFGHLDARFERGTQYPYPHGGWASVASSGTVYVHPTRLAAPEEWLFLLAHGVLHLCFDQFEPMRRLHPETVRAWQVACDCVCAQFLHTLKIGRAPEAFGDLRLLPALSEERWFERFTTEGIPVAWQRLSTAGAFHNAMQLLPPQAPSRWYTPKSFPQQFAEGLAESVATAVETAAGTTLPRHGDAKAEQARAWFISSYPLLGALAACFEIVTDVTICQRLHIHIAAVDEVSREIFINPAAGLSQDEMRFVMAHELLHVGLRHLERRQGRDAFLWNVACDFVINGWLVSMHVGAVPAGGLLYDPALVDESAEAIYDRLARDLRRSRKLATLAGAGLGDMLERTPYRHSDSGVTDFDEFCRRALQQGLHYHQDSGRGFLPAGLIEEIRALDHPPIPWDVALARWFDQYFAPLEQQRTYARVSRRQSATPDIPRPLWVPSADPEDARTFGVVLDTSGSMDRHLLAQCLGAIASYCLAREVPAVRVVFCDAVPYDQGYMPPEAIADRVVIKGRGGTVLQPGIDLLEGAADFPRTAPILLMTDGGVRCAAAAARARFSAAGRGVAAVYAAWAGVPGGVGASLEGFPGAD